MSVQLADELRDLIAQNRQLEGRFSDLQRTIATIRRDLEVAEVRGPAGPKRPTGGPNRRPTGVSAPTPGGQGVAAS